MLRTFAIASPARNTATIIRILRRARDQIENHTAVDGSNGDENVHTPLNRALHAANLMPQWNTGFTIRSLYSHAPPLRLM
jgi:hypothetical protein